MKSKTIKIGKHLYKIYVDDVEINIYQMTFNEVLINKATFLTETGLELFGNNLVRSVWKEYKKSQGV